jgi:hypothetical protein
MTERIRTNLSETVKYLGGDLGVIPELGHDEVIHQLLEVVGECGDLVCVGDVDEAGSVGKCEQHGYVGWETTIARRFLRVGRVDSEGRMGSGTCVRCSFEDVRLMDAYPTGFYLTTRRSVGRENAIRAAVAARMTDCVILRLVG